MSKAAVWALLGERTGDNNQVLALAESLGIPFEIKDVRYNALRALTKWLGPTTATLDARSRAEIQPPWPNVVISIGRRSVPLAWWIRKQSGGRTKIVLIGNPRRDPALFDLIITTRQYPVPRGDNVVMLPAAMSRFQTPPAPTADEMDWLRGLPHPVRLVAIGGATKYWELSPDLIVKALHQLRAKPDGSIVVVTSRRTIEVVTSAVKAMLDGKPNAKVVTGPFPRFATLLGQADEIFVTGDSVSMLSEAILTGKPVGLIPIEQNAKGRKKLGPKPNEQGPNARRRDLRRFWRHLQDEGVIGTLERPTSGTIDNPNAIAIEAVRAILD
jgi:mitochondrial fission protein ELM1